MYEKIGLAAMFLSIPLAFVAPPEITFENHLIENLQVIILIFLAAVNVKFSLASKLQLKWYHIFCAILFFVFALRELSWGRVFFQIGTEISGEPIFISMADYPYRIPIYIFLAICIFALLFILIKFLPVKKFLFGKKPMGALAVMCGAIFLAYVGEHGYFIGKEYGEALEEFEELTAYLMLPRICLFYREFLKR